MTTIASSELPVNPDGTIFHLHLHPTDIADNIILFGDPGRVTLAARLLHTIEIDKQNREYHTITGTYAGKRITLLSHGIGIGNIDIVVNELDALANINLNTHQPNPTHRSLNLIRIGTSGAINPNLSIGHRVVSVKSIGLDGVLYYYNPIAEIRDTKLEDAYFHHMPNYIRWAHPYAVTSDSTLNQRLAFDCIKGITISAPGFYGPQGRQLRLPLRRPDYNQYFETFLYQRMHILNYEMESSLLIGLAHALHHHATTICLIIAQRNQGNINTDYQALMTNLISDILKRI